MTLIDCTSEHWREVPDYEGLYEVSTEGRVRLMRDRGGNGQGRWLKGRILKLKPCRAKVYRVVQITRGDGKKTSPKIHQLVMAAFVGPAPEDRWQINHRDGNSTNNHICNLEYCTPSENQIHRYRVLGNRNNNAKFTDDQVLEIRARYAAGERNGQLAKAFGVTTTCIHHIVRGKVYKHV